MRLFVLPLLFFFFSGCSSSPVPTSEKAVTAKHEIEKNISEAQKARMEYLALQRKRAKESNSIPDGLTLD